MSNSNLYFRIKSIFFFDNIKTPPMQKRAFTGYTDNTDVAL